MKLDRSSGGYEIAANVFKYAGIELFLARKCMLKTIRCTTKRQPTTFLLKSFN